MTTTMMMKQEIPEELITDILWRLSISDSARFRCVCKSWGALLSDPSFILRDDKTADSRRLQIMINFADKNDRSVYNFYSADTLEPLLPSPVPLPFEPEIQGPLSDYPHRGLQVRGCCNGLICISDGAHDLILWNPATSETKVIPPSPFYRRYLLNLGAVGFGFDPETNDYKILAQFDNDDADYCLELYSLRNDSWTELYAADGDHKNDKRWLSHRRIPQCNKGKLYWWYMTWKKSTLQFRSFDMSSQEFEKVDLPCPFVNAHDTLECLLKEESMVAAVPTLYDTDDVEEYATSWEIWVLLKYWVSESWTKAVVIMTNSLPPGMNIFSCFGISRRNSKCLLVTVPGSSMRKDYYKYYYYGEDMSFIGFHPETGKFSDLDLETQGNRLLVMIDYMPSQVCMRDLSN